MTSYTRARHIAIPEKSVFRLVSRVIGRWLFLNPTYRYCRFSGLWFVVAPCEADFVGEMDCGVLAFD